MTTTKMTIYLALALATLAILVTIAAYALSGPSHSSYCERYGGPTDAAKTECDLGVAKAGWNR
jgi:hypothetical protein